MLFCCKAPHLCILAPIHIPRGTTAAQHRRYSIVDTAGRRRFPECTAPSTTPATGSSRAISHHLVAHPQSAA
ncbi:hypothetical protein BU16DRAFT_277290 [Lophium mytilinum]|uniref:Uncharacterized protein n=1 Tax=Lophium mytilinum TaxID=390894 RepID=A0A6A6R4Y3_9PEZI|nr:hypothetical protein BU16DRAFT_277290 [Lophium mytilinum]